MESDLMGYVRKSNSGKAVKISLDKKELKNAPTYKGADGKTYISLIITTRHMDDVMSGKKAVSAVVAIKNVE